MYMVPALNVVVYPLPGPPGAEIEDHAAKFVARKSVCESGGGLGYLVLVRSDFDRLWEGVSAGDAIGTAYAVLHFLGPNAHPFIGRHDDFIFGWVGDEDTMEGRTLLLQIVPREHMVADLN